MRDNTILHKFPLPLNTGANILSHIITHLLYYISTRGMANTTSL